MATLLIMALRQESQNLFENMQIFPAYCGVGQLNAAYTTHKLILERKPQHVLNLGTAGSHTLPVGTLVECTSFVQRAPADTLTIPTKTLHTPSRTDLPPAVCGTADFISTSPSSFKCDVMDMEAYAMAFVCEKMQIPFTSIKYVTDQSDAKTAEDWKHNLLPGAHMLLEQYKKNFSGAQGEINKR